jgi:hypothetical protein
MRKLRPPGKRMSSGAQRSSTAIVSLGTSAISAWSNA